MTRHTNLLSSHHWPSLTCNSTKPAALNQCLYLSIYPSFNHTLIVSVSCHDIHFDGSELNKSTALPFPYQTNSDCWGKRLEKGEYSTLLDFTLLLRHTNTTPEQSLSIIILPPFIRPLYHETNISARPILPTTLPYPISPALSKFNLSIGTLPHLTWSVLPLHHSPPSNTFLLHAPPSTFLALGLALAYWTFSLYLPHLSPRDSHDKQNTSNR